MSARGRGRPPARDAFLEDAAEDWPAPAWHPDVREGWSHEAIEANRRTEIYEHLRVATIRRQGTVLKD